MTTKTENIIKWMLIALVAILFLGSAFGKNCWEKGYND